MGVTHALLGLDLSGELALQKLRYFPIAPCDAPFDSPVQVVDTLATTNTTSDYFVARVRRRMASRMAEWPSWSSPLPPPSSVLIVAFEFDFHLTRL